jgi:exportin-T
MQGKDSNSTLYHHVVSGLTRGLHNPKSSVRARVFYLFHRFIKDNQREISLELAGTILEGIRDTLSIRVELPEVDPNEPNDPLTEATSTPDPQLYLFETVGTLVHLFFRTPEQSSALLLSVVTPLLEELSANLRAFEEKQDVLPIVKIHHVIMALGNLAKGFPEYPTPVPDDFILPPLHVFRNVAQAILMSLGAMKEFKVVRDAVCPHFISLGLAAECQWLVDSICICAYLCHYRSRSH